MKTIQTLLIILTLISIYSCSSIPMTQSSESQLRTMVADLQIELGTYREEVARLHGKIEEVEYHSNQKIQESEKNNSENIAVLQEQMKNVITFQETQSMLNKEIASSLEENKNLIISIDKNYRNFRKDSINIGAKARLKKATQFFGDKDYLKAIEEYSYFLDHPNQLSRDEFQIVLYRIALSEYRTNQPEASLIHFSQLYDKFHKENDKYMASALYHIGNLLIKEGKCKEAQQVFKQIDLDYTHDYFKNEAVKQLENMKNLSVCKGQLG